MISAVMFVIAVAITMYFVTSRHNQVKLYGAIGGWLMNVFNAVLIVATVVCLAVLVGLALHVLILDRDHVRMANYEFMLFMFFALVLTVLQGVFIKISTDEMILRQEYPTARERRVRRFGWWLHMHGVVAVGMGVSSAWWCLQHPQESRLGGLNLQLMVGGIIVIVIGAIELMLYKAWDWSARRFRKR